MENQLIREQVFDVLFNYVKIADGIFTESDCATVRDEICLRIDQSQFTADEAEDYINQEVEKRIAERMPSEEEINKQAEQAMQRDTKDGRIGIIIDSTYYGVFCDALEWLRSRLTCSEKPNNLTEGGEWWKKLFGKSYSGSLIL